jgi:hypothetical protein
MMDAHRGGVDVRFQRVERVRQRRQRKGHEISGMSFGV